MAELKHLRPRTALRPTLATIGLAVIRLELAAGAALAEHGHDVLELVWVERGALVHHLGPASVPGPRGSLLVVPQGRVHHYTVGRRGAVLWNLVIDPERIAAPALPTPLRRHVATLLPAHGGAALVVHAVDLLAPLTGLRDEQMQSGAGHLLGMSLHTRLLLLAAARAIHAGRSQALAGGDPRIEALRRRIDEQPELTWTLSAMATEAGLGVPGLVRAFRRHVDCTPMAYVRLARLRLARALVNDGATIAEAARAVGYAAAPALVRACRLATGTTPGAWRVTPDRR